jgi:hypothetical protein
MQLKTFYTSIFITIISVFSVLAQVDSTNQSLSLTIGASLPMSNYAATTNDGGYAKLGLAIQSNYSYNFTQSIGAIASYNFFRNTINADALANNFKTKVESQIERSVDYSSSTANNWNAHSVLIGLNYLKSLTSNNKLAFHATMLAGSAFVYSPASETTVFVNNVFYRTTVKRSFNACLSYQIQAGLSYKTGPKTSLNFNANYLGMNLEGYNLEITDVGNNSYLNNKYQFKQSIEMLNLSIGIATHF